MKFPGKYISWELDGNLYISIPFTWELPKLKNWLKKGFCFWKKIVVGGPAVKLIPNYFENINNVEIKDHYVGALQRVNPLATKTTVGCCNKCDFCGVPKIEGQLIELDDWPDLPIICDNNLLAASKSHFDRVIDRLIPHGWANFNQGLDARRLTDYHAMRIAEIKDPMIYLALDNISYRDSWECAYDKLRSAGILKRQIRTYALVGFNSDPQEAWERCNFIESHGVIVNPQWFHRLDAMEHNIVTDEQLILGWNDYERRKIMQWFYKHKKAVVK